MKIQNKLFLILFSFSIALISTLILLMQWSIGKGMIDYVNTKEIEQLAPLNVKLARIYQQENDWSAMQGKNRQFMDLVFDELGQNTGPRRPPPHHRGGGPRKSRPEHDRFEGEGRNPPPHPSQGRNEEQKPPEHPVSYALINENGQVIAGVYGDKDDFNLSAIKARGLTVGYLAVSKRSRLAEGYELDFIKKQTKYLWLFAGVALVLVMLLTLIITRHIVVPVKLIAKSIHRLTKGYYEQTVKLERKDELGDLNRDCNELAATLAENENGRKRWLAATSHELRTPVAILSGELEAMYHGVRPLNKENVQSSIDEVKHLSRLINDLHQLNSADIGGMDFQKQRENVAFLLVNEQDKYETFLANNNIMFNQKLLEHEASVELDKTRFFQLIDNVFDNVIKYADASLVEIELTIEKVDGESNVVVKVSDDGVGVDQEHMAKLFDYLYRVDDSRNRSTGGSGLGLSICHRIVDAHHGTITAEASSFGGLAIVIKLPML